MRPLTGDISKLTIEMLVLRGVRELIGLALPGGGGGVGGGDGVGGGAEATLTYITAAASSASVHPAPRASAPWPSCARPAFHTSGMFGSGTGFCASFGLAHDERLAFLQTGERVLNRGKTTACHHLYGAGGILGTAGAVGHSSGMRCYHDGGYVGDELPMVPSQQGTA